MIWMRNKSSVLIALVISWPASYMAAVIRQTYTPACRAVKSWQQKGKTYVTTIQ